MQIVLCPWTAFLPRCNGAIQSLNSLSTILGRCVLGHTFRQVCKDGVVLQSLYTQVYEDDAVSQDSFSRQVYGHGALSLHSFSSEIYRDSAASLNSLSR